MGLSKPCMFHTLKRRVVRNFLRDLHPPSRICVPCDSTDVQSHNDPKICDVHAPCFVANRWVPPTFDLCRASHCALENRLATVVSDLFVLFECHPKTTSILDMFRSAISGSCHPFPFQPMRELRLEVAHPPCKALDPP